MRILLVEDDAVLRAVMLRSLNDAGHRVDEATTMDEARHWWLVQVYDSVLLDLNLPVSSLPRAGLGNGLMVLREACLTLRRWLDAGLAAVPVACNLSVHQFTDMLPAQLTALLRETGVPAHLLQLEITETVMMNNAALHLDTMRQIKRLGVQIALDDFGTGYSSLSYLRHMDLDVLKIDRSFVNDLGSSGDARAIVAAIIAMAGKFDMKTVAEGVETPEQAQALRGMQCNDYQGFLFSQALPAAQFETQYLLPAERAERSR